MSHITISEQVQLEHTYVSLVPKHGRIEFHHGGECVGKIHLESPMRFEGDPEAALVVLSEVLKTLLAHPKNWQ
ncbi:MAG: hypothetical protein ACTSPX_03365 [Candidatus Thorarchaeota archaeon]